MNRAEFECLLDAICRVLTREAQDEPFSRAVDFENRVRQLAHDELIKRVGNGSIIDFNPHPHGFPDIGVREFGIEVKFTTNDTWRSVANSVLETNRVPNVETIYIVFGKMGGTPQVRWGSYASCVVHVRTSHVPRFEVDIDAKTSLFDTMQIEYDEFRRLEMAEKMRHIRSYARGRLRPGERLWWLEDDPEEGQHSLSINARIYTSLSNGEKVALRAEAVILCPQIVSSGRSRNKYDDVVLYLLTYRGVLCHNARDLFSAGSVANPRNDVEHQGRGHIEKALLLIEADLKLAAARLPNELFEEYWGQSYRPEERLKEWLKRADKFATDWKPSQVLFQDGFEL